VATFLVYSSSRFVVSHLLLVLHSLGGHRFYLVATNLYWDHLYASRRIEENSKKRRKKKII